MSVEVETKSSKKIPILSISRVAIQLLSFILVNYLILELIFKTDFDLLARLFQVLPFLHAANNPWTSGAGLYEYAFYAISQGDIPFFIVGLIGFFGLFTGRIFCGWMCPTGFLQDLFGGLRTTGKKFKINANIGILTNSLIVIMMIFLIPQQILIFQAFGLGVIGYGIAQVIPWVVWTILTR